MYLNRAMDCAPCAMNLPLSTPKNESNSKKSIPLASEPKKKKLPRKQNRDSNWFCQSCYRVSQMREFPPFGLTAFDASFPRPPEAKRQALRTNPIITFGQNGYGAQSECYFGMGSKSPPGTKGPTNLWS